MLVLTCNRVCYIIYKVKKVIFSEDADLTELYCSKCGEKIKYTGEGAHICRVCGYKKYYRDSDAQTLELYSKAEYYQRDEQYFNALQMYEIIIKQDESDYTAYFGAILAEYGVKYQNTHDGNFIFLCERTHSDSIYDSEYYKRLKETAPTEVMAEYDIVIAQIYEQQKKNNEAYLASAPVEEAKDYRAEARHTDEVLSDDYLAAREKYLERERLEQDEADKKRQEAKAREEAAQKARENRALLAKKREKRKKTAIITAMAVVALTLVTLLTVFLIVPMIKYSVAVSDIEKGDYDSAARTLRSISWYADSKELLSKYSFYGLDTGDTVIFGEYEQDGVGSAAGEYIEWIVLSSDGESVTLMSKYVLDCVMYHEDKDYPAYWETSSVRQWLNSEFFDAAFSDEEAAMIMTVHNTNPDNTKCGTKGGNATDDRVYLLCIDEVKELVSEEQLYALPTAYALSRGVYTKTGYNATYWWLRSPGSSQNSAAKVSYEGKIDERGSSVNFTSYGVRPVITIKKAVSE